MSTHSDDIVSRAPVLVPDTGRSQDPASQRPSTAVDVLSQQEHRIRELEYVVKNCDRMLARQSRQELRRRQRQQRLRRIDDGEVRALVDRMFYEQERKKQEREDRVRRELDASAPSLVKSTPTRLGQSYELGERLREFVDSYASKNVVSRNFEDALERRQQRLEQMASELQQPHRAPKYLEAAEVADLADRLCTKELSDRKGRRCRLQEKYESIRNSRPQSPALSKKSQAESADRLCTKAVEHRKQKIEELREKYSPAPERKVLSRQQMAASAARLYAGAMD
eukprot:TRINITY_DN7791_c2_g1_i1.p1 TRINITY_DN7791_c2_g1~~TRINITY_DN7791_c2_g1_i1.p1  ORF type:complete len:308 (+),score=110.68 TRINITY_DN7791_c2_g1_i1:80-925(+)